MVICSILGVGAIIEFGALTKFLLHDSGGLAQIRAQHKANGTAVLPTTQTDLQTQPVVQSAPLSQSSLKSGNSFIEEVIKQAQELRAKGETTAAIARLKDAAHMSPTDNPQIISEMALTYEAMQLPERAIVQWRHLFNMGPSAGAPYYLADAKLKTPLAVPKPEPLAETEQSIASVASTPEGLSSYASVNEEAINENPSSTTATSTDSSGPRIAKALQVDPASAHSDFPGDTVLRVENLTLDYANHDPQVAQKVVMRMEVKPRPGVMINPNEVKVETYFYDFIGNKDIVLTNAETNYQWLTADVNWEHGKTEMLQTTYLRMQSSTSPPPWEKRTFAGYQVRVYYKNELQDSRAEPNRLLQLYPAPFEIQE